MTDKENLGKNDEVRDKLTSSLPSAWQTFMFGRHFSELGVRVGVRQRARPLTETGEADGTQARSHVPKNTADCFSESLCRWQLIEPLYNIKITPL